MSQQFLVMMKAKRTDQGWSPLWWTETQTEAERTCYEIMDAPSGIGPVEELAVIGRATPLAGIGLLEFTYIAWRHDGAWWQQRPHEGPHRRQGKESSSDATHTAAPHTP